MSKTVYDSIGKDYNSTRRADRYITDRLISLLGVVEEGRYIDIGCGTGNYTKALADAGLNITGVEPSATMLSHARQANRDILFIQAYAEDLPLQANSFDGAIATFTIHHWNNLRQGMKEIARILKPGSSLICLSFSPVQLMNYWLCHYFPVTMKNSAKVVLEQEQMIDLFHESGFEVVETEKYFVQKSLTDHFLYSNKYRPEQYLLPEVRKNASSFTVYAHQEEIEPGLKQLSVDIQSGKIQSVIQEYENDYGDYLFYKALKK